MLVDRGDRLYTSRMRRPPSSGHSRARTLWHWLRTPYPYLDSLVREHGETFRIVLAGMKLVVFSNPEHVKEIFADSGDELEAGRFNRSIAALLGDRSVLMVDGAEHRRKRKLLLPPFRGERMTVYGKTMLEITDEEIDSFPHGVPFSLHEPMQEITLRVIIRTIFGFEGPREREMAESTKRLLAIGTWPPMLIPAMQFDLGRFSPYGRFRRAVAESDALLYAEIERRKRDRVRGPDILSMLLDARDEAGHAMAPEELRDELVTLLVAGHETTATALTWAMRWLLEDPYSVLALRMEIQRLGPDPTPEMLAKCDLLEAVAREALRLVPVIPIVGRMLTKDRTIGGYDLKKGEIAIASIYLAHRRPEVYRDPDRFDPSRFVGDKTTAWQFIPFGGGVRRCIGMAFALHEMKLVLARLVMRTDLELASSEPVEMVRRSITITPSKGLRVVMKRRVPSRSITAASAFDG